MDFQCHSHCSWTKFGIKKNSHKNRKRSNVENEYTIILMYHMKRSVGKFLRYSIFFIFTYHTLYFANALWHVWYINEINTSILTIKGFCDKIREFDLSNFVWKWLNHPLKCCSVWQTIQFSFTQVFFFCIHV